MKKEKEEKKEELTLRTIEEGRQGTRAGDSHCNPFHCNPLNFPDNCYNILRSCGGGSDSKYVGSNCPSETPTGSYQCNNCYWVKTCGSDNLWSWGGGASLTSPAIITEMEQHPRLIIGNCEVFAEYPNTGEIEIVQNNPEPFSDRTIVECYISETIQNVQFRIYDTQNALVRSMNVIERGSVNIEIQASELPSAGAYTCLLICNETISNELQINMIED